MKRFFTILEGAGKGETRTIPSTRAIVGRSRNADIQLEDPAISRRHLEIRVEGDAVFIENTSTQGSLLNGKPLSGVVSLNVGDELQLGQVRLRYEESAEAAIPAASADRPDDEAEIDGTRVAPPEAAAGRREDDGEGADHTRAAADDHTRIASEKELEVVWKAHEKEKTAAKQSLWPVLVLVLVVAVAGAGWWFLRAQKPSGASGMLTFRDSLFGYSIEYPADWSKTSSKADMVEFGIGNESAADFARLRILGDKQTAHATTGMTHGFAQYQEELKKRFPKFELSGSKLIEVNDAAVMFFGFNTPALQGKGMYLLNAETRLVLECYSPRGVYPNYASLFSTVLQSFHFLGAEPQQWIDFPMPDAAMQQLALGSPAALAQQVGELTRIGAALVTARTVKPENLFKAVQAYRQALQLAIAGPERAAEYAAAAQGLVQASKLFYEAVARQRFEISRALKERDTKAAYWAAHELMQMVPDKTDAVYQEAYQVARRNQPPPGGR